MLIVIPCPVASAQPVSVAHPCRKVRPGKLAVHAGIPRCGQFRDSGSRSKPHGCREPEQGVFHHRKGGFSTTSRLFRRTEKDDRRRSFTIIRIVMRGPVAFPLT
jgi:hypothetical protein